MERTDERSAPMPPARSRPARIKDVAALAGVSLKTVTNVVHDRPYVRDETRARVQAAIEQLDYRPSLVGRQLQSGRSNMITLAVPRIDEPYLGALAHQLIAAAAPRGYTVVMDETGGRLEREEQAARGYPGHNIDGVVYSPLALDPARMVQLSQATPMVLLGEPLAGSRADYVAIDNEASAREVVDHLHETGRTRVIFLGGHSQRWADVGGRRAAGVRNRLRELGAVFAGEVDTGRYTREEGARRIDEQLQQIRACDAIVCASDLLALGAIWALQRAGLRVPEDVAVVGWDNIEDGRYHAPGLTTVAPDLAALADRAMDALISRIEGNQDPGASYVVPHALLVRESSAAR